MAPADVRVEVVFCPQPGVIDLVSLALPLGATVAEALAASGLVQRHALPTEGLRLGVWGKLREATTVLRDTDRVEIYRLLTVDPKEARRQRYQRHQDTQKNKPAAG